MSIFKKKNKNDVNNQGKIDYIDNLLLNPRGKMSWQVLLIFIFIILGLILLFSYLLFYTEQIAILWTAIVVILLSIIIFAIYIYFNSKNYNYKQQIVSVNQKEYYENIKTLQKMREEEDNETLKKYLEKKEKEKKIMQDLQK
ncbi:MAG: hypothetical protein LBD05_02520 [Mycoplasmataceae bacterium]|nr:hypothetical protein [Mycoplasmataceae bacterium]